MSWRHPRSPASSIADAEAALREVLALDERFARFSARHTLLLVHNAKRLEARDASLASLGVVGGTVLHAVVLEPSSRA